jgi:hypothetical protein
MCLQVAGCGYGVTCHVRTFLHGCSRITLSIATLPSSDALPGEERGQVCSIEVYVTMYGHKSNNGLNCTGVHTTSSCSYSCNCIAFQTA